MVQHEGFPHFRLSLSLEYYLSALPAQAGQEPLLIQFLAKECHFLYSLWDKRYWKFLKSVLEVEGVWRRLKLGQAPAHL